MTIQIMDKNSKIVSRSKNLQGILRYARNVSQVERVDIMRKYGKDGHAVAIYFKNGSTCVTSFADLSVAYAWFQQHRNWKVKTINQENIRMIVITYQ